MKKVYINEEGENYCKNAFFAYESMSDEQIEAQGKAVENTVTGFFTKPDPATS